MGDGLARFILSLPLSSSSSCRGFSLLPWAALLVYGVLPPLLAGVGLDRLKTPVESHSSHLSDI